MLLEPAETGAVTLSLYQDVQGEAYDFPAEPVRAPHLAGSVAGRPRRRELNAAVEALRAAERPLLIAGGGVHYSEALPELAELAERLGVPVAETSAGKGALPAASSPWAALASPARARPTRSPATPTWCSPPGRG